MGARKIDKDHNRNLFMQRLKDADILRHGFVLCMLIMVAAGIVKMYQPTTLPFSKIQMFGEMKWLNKERLNAVVLENIDGGFFSLSVKKLKLRLEQLPWVKAVAIRRVWPNILQVNVHEQKPVAIWNSEKLINVHGELFEPPREEFPKDIVRIDGPRGYHVTLLEKLVVLNESMVPQGLAISSVEMDKRRAIEIKLQNGVKLLVGRLNSEFDQDGDLRRFAQVYRTTLSPKSGRIELVDLRYTNGFAVRWRQQQKVSQNTLIMREANKG